MEIITRKEAIERGLKHYYTGVPCKRGGHVTERVTSSSTCCECTRENHHIYYAKNREKALESIKRWSQKNNDRVAGATRKWRKTNPEAAKQTHKKYYDANKTKKLKYNKWWRSVNNDKQIAYNAKRRAQIKQALPAWADVDKITEIYTQSVEMSATTGITHHVDHIIPLVNDLVCGLHVHENLQVLLGEDNMSKSNKFVIDWL